MRYDEGAMAVVRAELCDRLDGLRHLSRRFSPHEFVEEVEGMRTLAVAYGLLPVARLAEALARALAEQGADLRRCPTALYLAGLEDAIGCDGADEKATQAMLASVSVRLSA